MTRVPSPSLGRNTSPPRLPPPLVASIEARAGRLGLKASIYLSILVHNDCTQPVRLTLREGRAPVTHEKRVSLPLSMPRELRAAGGIRARKCGGTFTAYLEELATRDIQKGGALLVLESKT